MRSLKKKIVLVTSLILFLSMAVITTILTVTSIINTRQTVKEIFEETTKTAAHVVQSKLVVVKDLVDELSMESALTAQGSTIVDKQKALDTIVGRNGFIAATMTDQNGAGLDGKNYAGTEAFKKAMAGEVYVDSPRPTEDGKSARMLIMAPLWKDGLKGGAVVGCVIGAVDGTYLSNITNDIEIGESGRAYIINKEGTTIANVNYNQILIGQNNSKLAETDPSMKNLAAVEQSAVNGEAAFGGIEFENVKKMIYLTPIEDTDGWSLGIYVDNKDFLQSTYNNAIFSVCMALVLILMGVLIMNRFGKRIAMPIVACAQRMQRLGEGDLSSPVPAINSKDETRTLVDSMEFIVQSQNRVIGDIKHILSNLAQGDFTVRSNAAEAYLGEYNGILVALNDVISQQNSTLTQIARGADQVFLGSEQVSSGAQTLSQGATEQASSIEEISATIQEVSDQAKLNSDSAKEVDGLSSNASRGIAESNRHMKDIVEAMENISTASMEISNIIKTIDGIAFQTNILALNAAIEAARAGAAGKGFAVVADEVRNLAQKSSEAAKNITVLIEGAITAVKRGTSIVDSAAHSLDAVVETTSLVADKVKEIYLASEQQTASIIQITEGIDQISAVVQTNSATAEESAATSEELTGQAQMLQEMVGKFKLEEGTAFEMQETNDPYCSFQNTEDGTKY